MPSVFKVSITLLFCVHFHLIKIHTLNKSLSLDHWTKALFNMDCILISVSSFLCDLEKNLLSPDLATVKWIL